ncbi:hypothetical protein FKM82_016983 [Ascaphus truei]
MDYEKKQVYVWQKPASNRRPNHCSQTNSSTPSRKGDQRPFTFKSILKTRSSNDSTSGESDFSDNGASGHSVSFCSKQDSHTESSKSSKGSNP